MVRISAGRLRVSRHPARFAPPSAFRATQRASRHPACFAPQDPRDGMHDTDFLHEHGELTEADRAEIARAIWSQENVELKTVGIDIGSSTSHLLFAKVVLQRQTQGLSSRFTVIDRQIVWRSPIMLTPFLRDGTIDAHRIAHFIADAYRDAGFARHDVDSGAVILTGEAIKRKNARAIDELFAAEAGKFVC